MIPIFKLSKTMTSTGAKFDQTLCGGVLALGARFNGRSVPFLAEKLEIPHPNRPRDAQMQTAVQALMSKAHLLSSCEATLHKPAKTSSRRSSPASLPLGGMTHRFDSLPRAD